MDSRAALKSGMDMADMVAMSYLSDLTDDDLLHRPHAKCNHLNWQVGHLIVSEHDMISRVPGAKLPALPAGMKEKYTRETQGVTDRSKFLSKEELLATHKAVRAGTLETLAATPDSVLDQPSGVEYAPTIGLLFSIQGSHWLMHAGQWAVVRRQLDKPVLI